MEFKVIEATLAILNKLPAGVGVEKAASQKKRKKKKQHDGSIYKEKRIDFYLRRYGYGYYNGENVVIVLMTTIVTSLR